MITPDPLDAAVPDKLNELLQDTIQFLEDSYSKFLGQEQEGKKEKDKEDDDSAVWLDDFIVDLLSWKADINASQGSLKSIEGTNRATRIADILISLKDGYVRELESSSDDIGTETVRQIEPRMRAFYEERLQLLHSYTDTILDHFWRSRTNGSSVNTLQKRIAAVRDTCLAEGREGPRRTQEIQQSVLPHAGVASSDETMIQKATKGLSQAEGQDRPRSQASEAVPRNSPIDPARQYGPVAPKPEYYTSARYEDYMLLEEHPEATDPKLAHPRGFSNGDPVRHDHEPHKAAGTAAGHHRTERWPVGPKPRSTSARPDELELHRRGGSSPRRGLLSQREHRERPPGYY